MTEPAEQVSVYKNRPFPPWEPNRSGFNIHFELSGTMIVGIPSETEATQWATILRQALNRDAQMSALKSIRAIMARNSQ